MSDRKRRLAIGFAVTALAIPATFTLTGCGDRADQERARSQPVEPAAVPQVEYQYDSGIDPAYDYVEPGYDYVDPGYAQPDPYYDYSYDDSQGGGVPYQEQTEGGYVGGDGDSSYYFDPGTGCSVVPGEGVSC
jgi:hypothetical protein